MTLIVIMCRGKNKPLLLVVARYKSFVAIQGNSHQFGWYDFNRTTFQESKKKEKEIREKGISTS